MKSLRPFQSEARQIANRYLNAGTSSAFVSPCGTGKTVTAAAITHDRNRLGKTVYVLVPQVEILGQWMEELNEWSLEPGYINDEGIRGKGRKVYVCMYQSLIGMLDIVPESLYPDEIFIDETQHMLAQSIQDICRYFHNAPRLGLTATLYHGSGETFLPWYTEYFQTITKAEAIEAGYITPPIAIVPEELCDSLAIPETADDIDPVKQAELLGEPRIIGDIIETYERLFCGRPAIFPCATFEQCDKTVKSFRDAGWNFEHLHSKLPVHERSRILEDVASQKCNGVCTVGIGVEGLSINGLWGTFWLTRTMSPIRWTQFNGRPERLYEGKKWALIVDPMGNTFIHGRPDTERKWSLDGEEPVPESEKTSMKCPKCGVYNSILNEVCHLCGANFEEEAAKKQTCTRCRNYMVDEETICGAGVFNPIFMIASGCENFQAKGRKLPAMIDGELVAISTDGERIRIKEQSNEAKEAIKARRAEDAEERGRLEEISEVEKRQLLKAELFKDTGRRKLFKEALGGMA